jgi:hypothetical protein
VVSGEWEEGKPCHGFPGEANEPWHGYLKEKGSNLFLKKKL